MSVFFVANLTSGTIYKSSYSDKESALAAAATKFVEGKGQIGVVELVGTVEPVVLMRTGDQTVVMAGSLVLGTLEPSKQNRFIASTEEEK